MSNKSTCCNAPIRQTFKGVYDRGEPYIFNCTKCGKACDVMSATISEFIQRFFRVGTDIPLNSADDDIGKQIGAQMLCFLRETEEAALCQGAIEALEELLTHMVHLECEDQDMNRMAYLPPSAVNEMISSLKQS